MSTGSRDCGHLAQRNDCCGDVPCCAVAGIGFVISGVHAPELLDLAEVVFDEVSPFVGFGVVREVQDAVAFGGNDGFCLPAVQLGTQVVCIKGLVGHQGVESQPFDQGRDAGNFVALTWKKGKAHQVAKCVRQGQNFRRQPAF